MNDKGIGAVFCLIAALLMSARYLSAAIFMSGITDWSAELFSAALDYVGTPLKTASVAALLAGIAFLACGIYRDIKHKDKF